ncbi:hypothetical protein M4D68_00835 [Priestia aryabhattai]|uniref:DUF4376 domain-containing protein n=1 Tax=Priestia aryabhattai TaxID=412384 RepID=UPI00203B6C7A|nr:hypothetical protein [Priestia aryabhattai]MCM3639690.1 hypothetical protein [Priestia aryabhattai]
MEKQIIVYNKDFEGVNSIKGVTSFTAYLDKVEYESVLAGVGSISGFENCYVVVDEDLEADQVEMQTIVDFYRPLKVSEMSQKCTEAIEAGFEYDEDFFEYDKTAQSNFSATMMQLLLSPTLDQVYITGEIKGGRYVDRAYFLDLYNASESHKTSQNKKLNELKDLINKGTFATLENLKNVTWDNS